MPGCRICLQSIQSEDNTYKLDCEHEFHTDCIISWFRSGKKTCPLCRKAPIYCNSFTISMETCIETIIFIAENKPLAPEELKKLVKRYKLKLNQKKRYKTQYNILINSEEKGTFQQLHQKIDSVEKKILTTTKDIIRLEDMLLSFPVERMVMPINNT